MKFYAYTRVSTRKQGEQGVSLTEQRDAIAAYAQKNGLAIDTWFEECVTAAKAGRPVFAQMMKGLKKGKADGLIIHKIDRSARNLRDWNDIGDLIDAGISVYFANDSIDLHTRGGRLSADIQAIVAADYIRNLREEVIKGIRGRLKAGLIPFGAPVGYLDRGKGGQAKEIDPFKGPLVRQAFELYAYGSHTLETLLTELHRRGLRNKKGNTLCLNSLSIILNNPFYAGLIRVKRTGDTFQGAHQPLISMALFKHVQGRLIGKVRHHGAVHEFAFRGLFKCSLCNRVLLGEVQKGHKYYRCHTKGCPTKTFREELLEDSILQSWPPLALTDEDLKHIHDEIDSVLLEDGSDDTKRRGELHAHIAALQERQTKLVDAMLDGIVEKSTFQQRKTALDEQERSLRESLESSRVQGINVKKFILDTLELATTAQQSYEIADGAFRRELVMKMCSNLTASGKCVSVEPHFAVAYISEHVAILQGARHRGTTRTTQRLARELYTWAKSTLGNIKTENRVAQLA